MVNIIHKKVVGIYMNPDYWIESGITNAALFITAQQWRNGDINKIDWRYWTVRNNHNNIKMEPIHKLIKW